MPAPNRSFASRAGMKKPKKAKNPLNQPAVDRLFKIYETAQAQNSNYFHTVNRAMSSLAACRHAIETRQQAQELKGVGAHCAKIIVPSNTILSRSSSLNSTSSSTLSRSSSLDSTSTTDTNNSRKRTRKTKLSKEESFAKPSAKQLGHEKAVKDAEQMVLTRTGWKAVLLLDDREQRGEHMQAKLQMSGVPCEKRHLPIGDMAWIARSGDQEVMLGTIVERKTTEDLASSLFGTRYLEQRLRLQHCGLTQVLLLVEGDLNAVRNCPADTLKMAMMETRVQLNFQVVQTRHLDDTVKFLKGVHRRILQRSFPSAFGGLSTSSLPSFRSPDAQPRPRKKTKRSLVDMVMDTPPKPELGAKRLMTYVELKAKVERDREAGTRTVGAIYLAMLKQIPTFSHKKVQAIGQAYPTPSALLQAFDGLEEDDGKTLVKDLSTNDGAERQCRIGPKSAAELYNVCTQGGDPNRKPAARPVTETVASAKPAPKQLSKLAALKPAAKSATEPDELQTKPKAKKNTPKRSNVATKKKTRNPVNAGGASLDNGVEDAFILGSDEAATPQDKAFETPSVAASSPLEEWSCARCTLKNGADVDSCEVCGSPKPVRGSVPNESSLAAYDLTQDSHPISEEKETPNQSLLNISVYSEGQQHAFDWADDAGPVPAFEQTPSTRKAKSPPNLQDEESGGECVDLSQDDSSIEVLLEDGSPDTGASGSASVNCGETLSSQISPACQEDTPGSSRSDTKQAPTPETSQDDPVDVEPEHAKADTNVSVAKPHRRLVALDIAPWDESSSEDDDDDDDSEPLFVRCQRRQEALKAKQPKESMENPREGSNDDYRSSLPRQPNEEVLDVASSSEEDESPQQYGNGRGRTSCSREANGTDGSTTEHAIEVIEID